MKIPRDSYLLPIGLIAAGVGYEVPVSIDGARDDCSFGGSEQGLTPSSGPFHRFSILGTFFLWAVVRQPGTPLGRSRLSSDAKASNPILTHSWVVS